MISKKELRQSVRIKVRALTEEQKICDSEKVLHKLECNSFFKKAKTVLLFYSLPDEVNTHNFIDKWSLSKKILLPVVQGEDIVLRSYVSSADMAEGDYHIGVPTGPEFTSLTDIDLVVVPGVAFDMNGNRMGRGKGYYDRFLAQDQLQNVHKIGLCYPCQQVECVPVEDHDIPMDEVIA